MSILYLQSINQAKTLKGVQREQELIGETLLATPYFVPLYHGT